MIVYRELSSLERDLGIPAKTLYGVSNSLPRHYHSVQLPKKSGGYRQLSVPDEVLKGIQRRITAALLVHMPVSPYAMAYRFGGSAVKNAGVHVDRPLVLRLDIYHFFDSVGYYTVKEKAFPAKIYAEPLRVLLALLCCCRDALPQGAPTSPAISNILLYDFDERVGRWCREREITYTRYCDDLTFSGAFDPAEAIQYVGAELQKLGFLLNGQKTRIQHQGQRQSVTGLVVNDKLNLPKAYRRKLRQELHYCRKFGVESHLERTGIEMDAAAYLRQLLGKVNYALQASPGDKALAEGRAWLVAEMRRSAGDTA